jgi:hypothetical protein
MNIKTFYVDGVKIGGRRSAIANADVTVTGAGQIKVGEARGTIISLR